MVLGAYNKIPIYPIFCIRKLDHRFSLHCFRVLTAMGWGGGWGCITCGGEYLAVANTILILRGSEGGRLILGNLGVGPNLKIENFKALSIQCCVVVLRGLCQMRVAGSST